MSDNQDPDKILDVIPFEGQVYRCTESIDELVKTDESFWIRSSNDELEFQLGPYALKNARRVVLEAVVADGPEGASSAVAFAHPDAHPAQPGQVIGVLVAPWGSKPEVDGVWVADDTEG